MSLRPGPVQPGSARTHIPSFLLLLSASLRPSLHSCSHLNHSVSAERDVCVLFGDMI